MCIYDQLQLQLKCSRCTQLVEATRRDVWCQSYLYFMHSIIRWPTVVALCGSRPVSSTASVSPHFIDRPTKSKSDSYSVNCIKVPEGHIQRLFLLPLSTVGRSPSGVEPHQTWRGDRGNCTILEFLVIDLMSMESRLVEENQEHIWCAHSDVSLLCVCMHFLGRLLWVDLITSVGLQCLSVCPSTKSFFNFDEIWYTGSARWEMHNGMTLTRIQGQGHEPMKVGNSTIIDHF